ncbi:MAG: sulfate adenylyltransferase subunit CysD [Gammaproteobacteria bacterium]|nr:sulfate adenylyltransferase subunit CysD [Gammaproteobacteria bacterium]
MDEESESAARDSGRLNRLESSALRTIRGAARSSRRPAMLFSAGKDSCVILHLARKAFAPAPPPFPLLSVDTTWDFPEILSFRDRVARSAGMELIVQINREGARRGVGPFTHGAAGHIRVMKSAALEQALDKHGFDALIDGARGDERRVRGSARAHAAGRPALRRGDKGDAAIGDEGAGIGRGPARIFPLAAWTERDVWRYIARERIEVPELYFAAERAVVPRNGLLIVRVDERMKLADGEREQAAKVRFRSLGCWPLSGAVRSEAQDAAAVLRELGREPRSERGGRAQDRIETGGATPQSGYF